MRSRVLGILTLLGVLVCSCGCLSLPAAGDFSVSEFYTGTAGSSQEIVVQAAYDRKAAEASSGAGSVSDAKIIRTASVSLEVSDFEGVLEELESIGARQGGYVSSSNAGVPGTGSAHATVILRIPADRFDATMDHIRALGTVRSQTVNAQDVTEEYVDLQARIDALEHQYEQYSRIMEKAETVEDILRVQVEMERVQVEMERITGRLRYFDNRIDLATITVSLREPTPVGTGIGHDFAAVFNAAIEAFLFTVDAIIIVFFILLPLILVGGGIYGVYRVRKRKKTGNNKPGEQ
ncbi:MAG: DUF4349 domain-containing protein [Methanomicrobiaceae archaeon]|nr:DUF4349 domain-containing protein [Methanomicrobiaceae archaeon]